MPFRQQDEEIKSQPLVGIGIDITEKCNRNCATCFAQHRPQDMPVSIFRQIVDDSAAAGFTEFYVLGGEPGLRRDLVDCLCYARAKFPLVILVTNVDFLADERVCQQVAETGVVVAAQRHVIEDTPAAREMEQLLTGGDHFDTSQQGWANVVKYFPADRVCVQCCITKPVVESGSIFDVFRWVRQNGFEPVMEFTKEGRSFCRGCALDVSRSEMLATLERFQRIDRDEFGLPGAALLGPQAYGKTCHMLENSIHFLVDGMAVPCTGHPKVSLGHIQRDGLAAILDNPLRQVFTNPADWIYGYCRDECPYFEECTGGCRGSSLDISGCPRASFFYCPHIPNNLTVADMIPPSCDGCPLQGHETCNPQRQKVGMVG